MKKLLLFITIINSGCYNAHYYPSQDEPVQVDDNGQPMDININVEQPRQPQAQPQTRSHKKYPKCIKWEKKK